MNPDYDKKITRVDSDELDTTLDTTLDTMLGSIDISSIDISSIDISSIDISSIYPSMMTTKGYVDSLTDLRADKRLIVDVLLEAFRSIAFEEPNDLAKTLIEYYYESKHNPEGKRINLLKKKLEDEYNLNI